MYDDERFQMMLDIADQFLWLCDNERHFSDQDLTVKFRGLFRMMDQVDPEAIYFKNIDPRVEQLIQKRGLRL